jgi:hypothetical protein
MAEVPTAGLLSVFSLHEAVSGAEVVCLVVSPLARSSCKEVVSSGALSSSEAFCEVVASEAPQELKTTAAKHTKVMKRIFLKHALR